MTQDEFYEKWLSTFACNVSKQNIAKYVIGMGGYLWHVFSWKLLPETQYLTGDAARSAFEQQVKSGAIYLDWFQDAEETRPLTPNMYTAKRVDRMTEVYIAAADFSWTYIKTHEDMCGPYFMKLG